VIRCAGKYLNSVFVLVIMCILPGAAAISQIEAAPRVTIFGRVVDAVTRSPLPLVNVYIANSVLGAATDNDGNFSIFNVPLGTHELVIAHVGYEAQKLTVRLTEPGDRNFIFKLNPKTLHAGEVVVTGSYPAEWKRNLGTFEKEFLGETPNALACEILNPEYLDFERDEQRGTFRARAHRLLHIVNRALGYRIHLLLEDFIIREGKVWYAVKPHFEELVPENQNELITWEKNRRITYMGSFQHFLAALCAGRLEEQGFAVRSMLKLPRKITVYTEDMIESAISPQALLADGELPFEKNLRFMAFLQVVYSHEMVEEEYRVSITNKFQAMSGRPLSTRKQYYQTSWLELNTRRALVNTSGYLYDPYAVTMYGYWGMERVAELLPVGYVPDK